MSEDRLTHVEYFRRKKNMQCEICGTSVKNMKTLDRISNINDVCFCSIANEITNLKKEIKILREQLSNFKCPKCDNKVYCSGIVNHILVFYCKVCSWRGRL